MTSWTNQARCRTVPQFLTYPLDVRAGYCAGCPVIVECQAAGRYTLVARPQRRQAAKWEPPAEPSWPAPPLSQNAFADVPTLIARRRRILETEYQYDVKSRKVVRHDDAKT